MEDTLSLADRLKAEQPVRKSRLETYVAELDERDRHALIAAAADQAWSNAALLRLLAAEGCAVGKDSFSAWRHSVTRG